MLRFTLLLVFPVALASCSEDAPTPLTPNLVIELKAYDLGNNGDASDMVVNNLHVEEYRIMIIPANASASFDVAAASTMSPASYVPVAAESFEDRYSIKRLTSGVLDVNGNPVQNQLEYVVAILVKGTGNFQLSEFSNPFTLKDQGTYSGRYGYSHVARCVRKLDGNIGGNQIPINAQMFVDIQAPGQGNEYSGTVNCTPDVVICVNGEAGTIFFKVVGTTITDFTYLFPAYPCTVPDFCDVGEPCPFMATGEGTIIDDLVLEILATNDECIRACEATYILVRQT